jgi:uncharacterized membrane protein
MKWFFISILVSLFSVFVLMAMFISSEDELSRTYDNLDVASKDGLVKDGLIPSTVNPSATKISVSFMPDSTRAFISFRYNGEYPIDANHWMYNVDRSVQRVFCKAKRHFNRKVFEGSLSYFELENSCGEVMYLAVDRKTRTAYITQ